MSRLQKIALMILQKKQLHGFENRNSLIGEKFSKEQKFKLIQKRKEVLFYRLSEIHSRARLVNESIKNTDLVICLHINAAPWKDPETIHLWFKEMTIMF